MNDAPSMGGAVYVQSNESENRVIAFRRGMDGALERIGDFPTGGKGDAMPHLTSQGSVLLTGDGRHLLVTIAASDDVSVFSIDADGTPSSMGDDLRRLGAEEHRGARGAGVRPGRRKAGVER